MGKPILSICVVTMNRAGQLKEALESCLACNLPSDTEFVIIDNASTDDTETVVKELFATKQYPLQYVKNEVNVGAGKGRNMYYDTALGKYIYGMDDDALIAVEKNRDFFTRSIDIMEQNPDIVTLATQIFDTAWGRDRLSVVGKEIAQGVYYCKMFCGGSHFLRKDFFECSPYLSNVYGYEELPPSLLAWDAGKINVFCPDLLAIHNPKLDKWNRADMKSNTFFIMECAVQYAIKKMMYPKMFSPVLSLAYEARCKKHLTGIPKGKKKGDAIVQETMSLYPVDKRIKVRTALDLYKKFGLSVF